MTIINSSTTGHSRFQERLFAKKLFFGLIALIIVSLVATFLVGQKRDLRPPGTEQSTEKPANL